MRLKKRLERKNIAAKKVEKYLHFFWHFFKRQALFFVSLPLFLLLLYDDVYADDEHPGLLFFGVVG